MGVKTKINRIKIIIGIILFGGAIILSLINAKTSKGIEIKHWDNYYNENNIVFFYENALAKNIEILNSTYKVNEFVKDETSEIDKVLKTVDILNSIVEYDDVPQTSFTNGYEILAQNGQRKKVSNRDMAIIERDLLISIGFDARTGMFRKKNAQFSSNAEYYVVEYWSTQYNKWIMIDFLDKGYFIEGDSKLSAIEVITKDIRKIAYLGNSSQHDYKNKINKYLDSYTLQIDNTISATKSNCYVTYIKDERALEIKFKDKFAPPTIFTQELKLFEKSPFDTQVGSDEKAYIIFGKSSETNTAKENEKNNKEKSKDNTIKLVIGGFRDDKIMDKYYLNINDSGYEETNKYKDIELKEGINKIELSLDGTNTISSIVINKGK